jgi:hypothetical protein
MEDNGRSLRRLRSALRCDAGPPAAHAQRHHLRQRDVDCDCPGRRIARVWCERKQRIIARRHHARLAGLTASPPFLANGAPPWHSTEAPSSPGDTHSTSPYRRPRHLPLERDAEPARPDHTLAGAIIYEAVQSFPARRIPHLSHSFQNLRALTQPTTPPSPNTPIT